ncbi:hypothetical protein H4R19_004976 [Coemansia spiralis]|nr:hypothetical protein H4R19_004976 [Coemansia spiralis]
MDFNLLGDDDDDHGRAPNLPPALQPQRPATAEASTAEQLRRLEVASDKDDADDFGDFLHSEAADDSWPAPEQPGPGVASPSEPRDPMGAAAAQLLAWISSAPKDGAAADPPPDASVAAASAAWESAEGLMGGANPGLHLGEIATRLCSAIPPWPHHAAPADAEQPPAEVSLESACRAAEAAAPVLPLDCAQLSSLTYGLVWPMYADRSPNEPPAGEDARLADAYLRLAKKVGRL